MVVELEKAARDRVREEGALTRYPLEQTDPGREQTHARRPHRPPSEWSFAAIDDFAVPSPWGGPHD